MNNDAVYSTMVRAGKVTFFIDVRESKSGAKYIAISESRIDADDKRQRSTIRAFGETIQPFLQAVNEASTAAQQ